MHKILPFLKGAVTRGATAGIMGCYFVHNGMLYSRNEAVQAGAPFADVPANFNIPADDLDRVLGRMDKAVYALGERGELIIKSGRLRSTIQCVPGEPPPIVDFDGPWLTVPPTFIGALRQAAPFASTNPGWTSGIRLMNERITALNSRSGIDIYVPDLALDTVMITKNVADFIVEQVPHEYGQIPGALLFRWKDGRWAQAQLLTYEMPESVESILSSTGLDAPVEITADWRKAYADASALVESIVELHPGGFRGRNKASEVDIEFEQNVEECSWWETKVLDSVVEIASHWNPAAWPKPAFFKGPNFRGIVSGVKQ